MKNRKVSNEQTSKRVATAASAVLRDRSSSARERSVAGSALTQYKPRGKR